MQIIGIQEVSDSEVVRQAIVCREIANSYTAANVAAMEGRGRDIKAHEWHERASCYDAEAARRGLKVAERKVPFGHSSPDYTTTEGAMYPDEFESLPCLKGFDEPGRVLGMAALEPLGVPTWLNPIAAKSAEILRRILAAWEPEWRGRMGSQEALADLILEALKK